MTSIGAFNFGIGSNSPAATPAPAPVSFGLGSNSQQGQQDRFNIYSFCQIHLRNVIKLIYSQFNLFLTTYIDLVIITFILMIATLSLFIFVSHQYIDSAQRSRWVQFWRQHLCSSGLLRTQCTAVRSGSAATNFVYGDGRRWMIFHYFDRSSPFLKKLNYIVLYPYLIK